MSSYGYYNYNRGPELVGPFIALIFIALGFVLVLFLSSLEVPHKKYVQEGGRYKETTFIGR